MKRKAILLCTLCLLLATFCTGCGGEDTALTGIAQLLQDTAAASASAQNNNPDQGGTISVTGTANLDVYAHFPELRDMQPLENITLTSPSEFGYTVQILNYGHLRINQQALGEYIDLLHWLAWNKVTALDIQSRDHYIYLKAVPTTQHILVILPRAMAPSDLEPQGNNDKGGTQTGTNGTLSYAGIDAETYDIVEKAHTELRILVEACNAFIGSGNNGYNASESDALCNSIATATTLKTFGLQTDLQGIIDASKDGTWGRYSFMYLNSWDAYIGKQITQ